MTTVPVLPRCTRLVAVTSPPDPARLGHDVRPSPSSRHVGNFRCKVCIFKYFNDLRGSEPKCPALVIYRVITSPCVWTESVYAEPALPASYRQLACWGHRVPQDKARLDLN
jgi:hypothetical protein